jgi:mercuric reductase
MKNFDLIILGQGSAAFAAAIKANEMNVKTAMIGWEVTKGATLGGTCVNVGCVPSKNLITMGNLFYQTIMQEFDAIRYSKTEFDFKRAIEIKNELVKRFRRDKYADVLKGLDNVEFIHGYGRFVSKNEVVVGKSSLSSKKFLIATGARAKVLQLNGMDKIDYLTNEEALDLEELPESMIVLGGRALGLEFAQMYSKFGTKVTVLQRSNRILPDHEPEISSLLEGYLKDEGIDIRTGVELKNVSKKGKKKIVRYTFKGGEKEVEAEKLLFATGRIPNTDGLDAHKAGVRLTPQGFVSVNDEMHTSASNIWAAGDVIGEPMLETVAAKEGSIAVDNAFANGHKKINLVEVPRAVFTYPEVASVGLTDSQANGLGVKCACGVLPLDLVPKSHIIGDTRGLIKLVVERKTKRVVGVHILSPHAADLIHEGALIVKFKLTIDDIIDTVHVFPTLSEGIKLAAQSFYHDVSKMSCCTE